MPTPLRFASLAAFIVAAGLAACAPRSARLGIPACPRGPVANYLAGRGVMRDRMITIGAGETRPIASNDTEAGRAQNRRVEITLVPLEG